MEIALLIFCIINFLLIVTLLIYMIFVKKENKVVIDEVKLSKEQIESNAEIKLSINNIVNELPKITKIVMQEEIINLKNEFSQENIKNREGLEEFERIITKDLTTKVNELNEVMNTRIKEIQERVKGSIESGFVNTKESYKELTEQLTLLTEARNNIQNLSSEVVSLKNVLENNQHRGRFGELALERIMYSIFGDAKDGVYAFQYRLRNEEDREKPDAVIFLPEPNHLLCIDSKFPFAEYKNIIDGETEEIREASKKGFVQAIKTHITDINKKYIIKNKTADYAIMFVPSDALFGLIHAELKNVVEYAREKNVIITSPSTLQPILATINLVKIQYERKKNIDKVLQLLATLSKKFKLFTDGWETFSKRIGSLSQDKEKIETKVREINEQFGKINAVQGIETESENNQA